MGTDAHDHRAAVAAAGRNRLLTHGIDALRSQLNASALSSDAPVSRDTAYRSFRDDPNAANVTDAIVAAVTNSSHEVAWMGYDTAFEESVAAYEAVVHEGGDPDDGIRAGLQATFESHLRAPGLPVAWLLQASSLAASEAWKGESPPPDQVELGRHILERRRQWYRGLTRHMSGFLAAAMSVKGRRPRRGLTLDNMALLVCCLHDGLILRCLVDHENMTPAVAAGAMERVIDGLTETGPVHDPRRPPDDEPKHDLFDRMLDAAAELWSDPEAAVTVEATADRGGVPVEAATLMFPTVGDLADSLLRARVVGGGFTDLGPIPSDAKVSQHLVGLVTELRALCAFADDLPRAVATARDHPPTRSPAFVNDFVDNESRVVAAVGRVVDPAQLVRDLVAFAAQGSSGWTAVTALLRSIGYDMD
jgi:hypothetical protein